MPPPEALPISPEFSSVDEYVDSLLHFATASTIFQTLCGGVHILDFFTQEPSLYHKVIPEEWRVWLLRQDSMELLNFFMRDNLDTAREDAPPESLLRYVREIRKHSLQRQSTREPAEKKTKLPRHIAVGMVPKKIHEVSNFADYVVDVADSTGTGITHFVDFGSGQNYLGRTLASPPYNKHIVAVESKEGNIKGAKGMDVQAGIAEREKVMRNKKLFRQQQDNVKPEAEWSEKDFRRRAKKQEIVEDNGADLRPIKELDTIYTSAEGKGYMQYVEHIVKDGDLSNVVAQIQTMDTALPVGNTEDPSGRPIALEVTPPKDVRLMAISIHSCGNLSHHGIRSLVLNPSVHAVAIVGCCYNLLTERLGPPSYKLPLMRPNLRPINAPPTAYIEEHDPHGFPMSERVGTCDRGDGIGLNITARMMAVQAPWNWTPKDSDSFFTRHYWRALLQKMFLDYGVVGIAKSAEFPDSTEPVIIGSLRRSCYASFTTYVRGALAKLAADPERNMNALIDAKMGAMTDEDIERYAAEYDVKKKELSVTWSLMAFSAGAVESLIVVDRWLWLKEQPEVKDAWVEAVWDYGLSPRNLVVVGIKK
ncbi:hypothetical protein BP6252_08060 [Coleophoma cylindrospora]|uniref:Methyltransferase domain-containing protein n=1 Tax=Coleophoma cylindrospora TaxID=1849047 RepID=A0A3D8RBR5_9HELO|nr:hypothetical protein BP6252_08060 [Coleophoma cylindrospora]